MKFLRPKNRLEGGHKKTGKSGRPGKSGTTDENLTACPKCKKNNADLAERLNVCLYCGYHFRQTARHRLNYLCDKTGLDKPGLDKAIFEELDAAMTSTNILDFPEYDAKLEKAKSASKEQEAVITGLCEIDGQKAALFIMEPYFMMGSMGAVVGEKITRLFERALAERLPVIGYTVSGGARMQEGIFSLMQMAKISAAVKRHSDAGLLYICVLTDPTTGGVTASFAMEADITLAEPGALIGFAGPRVIEQTIRKKLPEGFQRADFIVEKGFADDIVERREQRGYLGRLLRMHGSPV